MGTKRTPIGRPPRSSITPRAIALFEEMRRLEDRCSCEPIIWRDDGKRNYPTCPSCERWWALNSELCDEMRLQPWEFPAVTNPAEPNPWPEGSYMHGQWKRDARGVALWRALDAASKATA